MKRLTVLVTTLTALPVFAHEGHGLFGSHWHATDAWGWLITGAVAAAVFWLSRGRK